MHVFMDLEFGRMKSSLASVGMQFGSFELIIVFFLVSMVMSESIASYRARSMLEKLKKEKFIDEAFCLIYLKII